MINENIKLWAPGEYNGAAPDFEPYMTTYILKDGDKKGAVLIIPGGSYSFVSWREAEPVAVWFNSLGYHAFVLYYSVSPNRYPKQISDATRAMCIIRDNAEKWNLDPNDITVCGFSAGGHLAATLGVHYDAECLKNIRGMESGKNKPNAMILCYPVITSGEYAHRGSFNALCGKGASNDLLYKMSLEKHVTENTPKTFIWSTFDDETVPVENSILFAQALKNAGVSCEIHLFPKGLHGLALCNKVTYDGDEEKINPYAGQWMDLCARWLSFK